MKQGVKVAILLGIYFLLLVLDIFANIAAFFIPVLGPVAESLSEIVIEIGSAVIVVILAFSGGKKK